MELRQLEYFVAVAELGSFTRAAERCQVAQPSLSQAIMTLEKDLRQQLFDRLGRKVQLTEAGRLLLDRAGVILGTVEDTRRQLLDFDHIGAISVGAIPTVAPYLLPSAVKRFRESHPDVHLTIREDFTAHLLEAIGAGELDLGIMALPITDSRVQSRTLFREELVLAIPADHALVRKKRIGLRELVDVPFILIDEMHCLGEQVMSFCRRHTFGPQVSCRGSQIATILSLVEVGQGISLIPEMAINRNDQSRCVYRSMGGEKPTRTIAAVWNRRRYRSPLVEAFLKEVKQPEKSQWIVGAVSADDPSV